jgi:hypothetical protein
MKSSAGFPQVEILIEPFQTYVFRSESRKSFILLAYHLFENWNQTMQYRASVPGCGEVGAN